MSARTQPPPAATAQPSPPASGWSKAQLAGLSQEIQAGKGATLAGADLSFVKNARALVRHKRRRGLRGWSPWLSVLLVGAALWWASWAELEEVTRGQGKVIPSKSVQIIQSLEGGILDQLFVQEGQTVEGGQKLLQIRDAIFSSTYQENLSRRDMLKARLARLTAEKDDLTAVAFPEDTRTDLVDVERELFTQRREDRLATEASLNSRLKLARAEESLLKGGTQSKAISMVELIRVQKEIAQLEGDLVTLRTTFRRQVMEQFDKDRSDHEMLVQAIKRDKDRLDRTVIQAPVRGIVNKIQINTVGRVIGSGQDIMTIVPLDDTLLIEANIRPADIGFIRPGQAATVKFTAYDFSVYGGLEGKVELIGVDTVSGDPQRTGQPARGTSATSAADANTSYYPIKVRTTKNTLGIDRHGQDLVIIPGMVAEVNILTGKKTVLNYLMRPINRAKERALREP
jgi:membrane fusion protein, adhesin transport system